MNVSFVNIGIFLLLFMVVWWVWVSNLIFVVCYGNEWCVYCWDMVVELILVVLFVVIICGDFE